MIVAITVWDNRISPVCDSANTLLVIESQRSQILGREFVPFPRDSPVSQVSVLKQLDVDCLICGAITRNLSLEVERAGIQIISFVSGDATDVLRIFLTDKQQLDSLTMPGVRRHRQKGKNAGRPKGRGNQHKIRKGGRHAGW